MRYKNTKSKNLPMFEVSTWTIIPKMPETRELKSESRNQESIIANFWKFSKMVRSEVIAARTSFRKKGTLLNIFKRTNTMTISYMFMKIPPKNYLKLIQSKILSQRSQIFQMKNNSVEMISRRKRSRRSLIQWRRKAIRRERMINGSKLRTWSQIIHSIRI